jgi:uncharacterized protein (DUF58 family)
MRILERSWVVILLWLATLITALATPPAQRDVFFNLAYLFGGLLLFSFLWAWLNLHWVRVTRQTRSRRSQVGKYAEERFTLENTGPLPKLWLEVRDHSELPGHQVSRVVNSLPAHRQRSWAVKTACYQRGHFGLGPVTLYSGDPFGLFLMQRDISLMSYIVVYPPTFDLPGFSPSTGQLPGGDALRRRTHYITTNVAGVRDYVPGDSFNRIHWPSTARTDRLIVKEFELDPMADFWLFLDMEKRVQAGSPQSPLPDLTIPPLLRVLREGSVRFELAPNTEEYAIAVAASLAKHFLDRNRAVGLVTYSRGKTREFVQTDRGERQLGRLLEILAVTHAEGTVPLAQLLVTETVNLTRATTVLVVTSSTDAGWVAALRHFTQRGVRPVAAVIDSDTFPPGGSAGGNERDTLDIVANLVTSRIPTYLVRYGDRLEIALSEANVRGV